MLARLSSPTIRFAAALLAVLPATAAGQLGQVLAVPATAAG